MWQLRFSVDIESNVHGPASRHPLDQSNHAEQRLEQLL